MSHPSLHSVPLAAILTAMALAIVLLVVGTVLYGGAAMAERPGGAGIFHAYLPMVAMGYGAIVILALAVVELRFYKIRVTELERREKNLCDAVAELEMAEESRGESLASVLHDDLGGGLTALRMELEMAERSPSPEAWTRCYAALDRLLAQVRGLSRAIYPKSVGSLGLTAMLRGISDTLGGTGRMRVEFSLSGPLDALPERLALCVLRIVQESVVNAVRHSTGDRVDVWVQSRDSAVFGSVVDNGTGRTECREGLGLTLLRERVHHLGGTLDIRLTDAGGVEVAFGLPVGKEVAA